MTTKTANPGSGQLTSVDLKTLKAPFPPDRMGVKVQSLNREKTRAMLVLYLQHTDVQDRLEEVDPAWSCETLDERHADGSVHVRSRLTLKGVSRENVGEGSDPKAAHSDALKRCAMLFGVGRYLYDSETVWADYNESRDRCKHWTLDDYEQAAARFAKPQKKAEESVAIAPPAIKPKAAAVKPSARTRQELNQTLMSLYRPYLTRNPNLHFTDLLQERYGVTETRQLSVEQLEDLTTFVQAQLASKPAVRQPAAAAHAS